MYSGKLVIFGEKGLYLCKSGCIWKGCIRANYLYSGKVVVFGQPGCIRVK